VWSQLAMGRSWRVGVDHDTPSELVTTGPFRYVRNPIYTAISLFLIAVVVLLPGVATGLLAAAALLCIELQVRVIEEPFLVAHYGAPYLAWAGATGRFVPGVGRRVKPARA
jgi:protein-S-isoprenylcysteine O-methyltransferase Ste14